jgi:hypothetical protein
MKVLHNRALGRIFGGKNEEVTGGWRKLHNKEFRNFYFSLVIINIIMFIKYMSVSWPGHVVGVRI